MPSVARLFGFVVIAGLLVACSDGNNASRQPDSTFSQSTVTVSSKAPPAYTPGTAGMVVENEKILRQFGAATFCILAENLLRRAADQANRVLEAWAVDRRSNHLEDTVGLGIAEDLSDPVLGMDVLFGDAIGPMRSELRLGAGQESINITATSQQFA